MEALSKNYEEKNVQVLIIDVKETDEVTAAWANDRHKFTFPVLLDRDGSVSASFAPKDVLPDLPRDEVPIASNLIIDPEGRIQFYSLLDSQNFDAKLIELKKVLDKLIAKS